MKKAVDPARDRRLSIYVRPDKYHNDMIVIFLNIDADKN
jgi:hypothetical protein